MTALYLQNRKIFQTAAASEFPTRKNPWNHLKVHAPNIRCGLYRDELDLIQAERICRVDLPTSAFFHLSADFFAIGLRILGFGLSYSRQTGY